MLYIEVKGKVAVTKGIFILHDANVYATNLCAGAALIVAACASNGISKIYNISYVDRSYKEVEEKFLDFKHNKKLVLGCV